MKNARSPLLRTVLALAVFAASAGLVESQALNDRGGATVKVIDFSTSGPTWRIINDGVMGGLSSSSMSVENGIGVFAGNVSLANSGGFASMRTMPGAYELGGFDRLIVRVRGDGNRYKLRLRTTDDFDGVSYQAAIDPPAGQWAEIVVPFEIFVPVYRGRVVRNHEPLDPSRIRTFGLLIADKQTGPFRLELEWIAAEQAGHRGTADVP